MLEPEPDPDKRYNVNNNDACLSFVQEYMKENTTENPMLLDIDNCMICENPNSNVSLKSGLCPVRELLEMGMLKIGLGTDVSGGCSPSMLDAMRYAIQVSKMRQEKHPITLAESFYMATLGGARALNMADSIGSFHPFDAIIVSVMNVPGNPVDISSIDRASNDTIFRKTNVLGHYTC